MKQIVSRFVLLLLATALLSALCCGATGLAAGAPPLDITANCRFTPSSHESSFRKAVDGLLTTTWSSDNGGMQSITIDVPKGQKVSGLYLRWENAQPAWTLYALDSKGSRRLCSRGGNNEQWMTEWAAVPDALSSNDRFVLEGSDSSQPLQLIELSVYTGGVPDFAPRWQPYDGKPIDTMVVACHPDDEDLYLGPALPESVSEGHKRNLVVTMTYVSPRRRVEASESDWLLGEAFYPELHKDIDVKTLNRQDAEYYWPLDKTEGYLVEQIRRYRPSVIVTHDINGEYGHGAHRETSYATQLAFRDAADPDKYPDSARRYGIWKAAKLYVHLYEKNPITLNTDSTVEEYGGRTIGQIVSAAYARHKSQLPGRALPFTGSRYDMQKLGLMVSRVGPDIHRDRLYENINADAMASLNPDNDAPRTPEWRSAPPADNLESTAPEPQDTAQALPQVQPIGASKGGVTAIHAAVAIVLILAALAALGIGAAALAKRRGRRR
jgi:LmbE family N-acetylglucosaminyl deacetylase